MDYAGIKETHGWLFTLSYLAWWASLLSWFLILRRAFKEGILVRILSCLTLLWWIVLSLWSLLAIGFAYGYGEPLILSGIALSFPITTLIVYFFLKAIGSPVYTNLWICVLLLIPPILHFETFRNASVHMQRFVSDIKIVDNLRTSLTDRIIYESTSNEVKVSKYTSYTRIPEKGLLVVYISMGQLLQESVFEGNKLIKPAIRTPSNYSVYHIGKGVWDHNVGEQELVQKYGLTLERIYSYR